MNTETITPTAPARFPLVDVMGLDVSTVTVDEVVTVIGHSIRDREQLLVSFVNPNYLMRASEDADLMDRMNRFDLMLADGWGVVLAARILGRRIPTRVANDDLTEPLFAMCSRDRIRVFLLGSAPGVAEQAMATLGARFPGVEFVGAMHGHLDVEGGHPGTYTDDDHRRMIDAVNAARPDLLVVGVPTPLQQQFVIDEAHRLQVPVIMTGGSWIDHLAERVQWYPPLVVKLRVCWLYRLAREPGRLWYRYSVELASFGRLTLRHRRRQNRQRRSAGSASSQPPRHSSSGVRS